MEWIWLLIAAGVGIYFWQRSRTSKSPPQASETPFGMNMASDRELILTTFRRELANYLIRLDPDRFLRLYRKAREVETAIETADKEEREAQRIIMTKRYPFYTDFDLAGTREHVLYADALSMYPIEDIEEHYLNLVKFQALQRALDPNWRYRAAATSDENEKHLQEYVRKIKDTKFRQRLMAAVDEFFSRRTSHPTELDRNPAYESDKLAVHYVTHIAENRYGFHFKDTNEYGLYGTFYDDERDKTYQSFYRSDRKFEAEHHLDYLRIDELI